MAMSVTVVVVSYNTGELLCECLRTVFDAARALTLQVVVVDNASADDSVARVKQEFPQVQLIENADNKGFAAANNQAFAIAQGDYIVLLNPDARLLPDSLERITDFMERTPDCGICGGLILNPDMSPAASARRFPNAWYKFCSMSGLSFHFPGSVFDRADYGSFAHDRDIEVDWVPGTFTILRQRMLDRIGWFDERFFMYYEETDLCLRARRSLRPAWKTLFFHEARVVHVGGASSKTRKDLSLTTAAPSFWATVCAARRCIFAKTSGSAACWPPWAWKYSFTDCACSCICVRARIIRPSAATVPITSATLWRRCPPRVWERAVRTTLVTRRSVHVRESEK